MPEERFLVTGGTGCIGSWVVRDLVREDVPVAVLTSGRGLQRLRLILSEEELRRVEWIVGDIADLPALERAGRSLDVTAIVHLAALQVPFCAADPLEGSRVNVVGTVAVFELARRLGIERVTYASSAAVYGPKALYGVDVLPADAAFHPTTHYGAFKVANELDARVWWETAGISSIGLRPHSVYGPGRDQGITSKPTVAMIAAAAGRGYRVNFGGRYQFQYVDDAARTFIAAARSRAVGAGVFSLPGPRIGVDEVVAAIERVEPATRGRITWADQPLPLPEGFDGAPLETVLGPQRLTGLEDGIRETIETYRRAIRDGIVDEAFVDRVLAG